MSIQNKTVLEIQNLSVKFKLKEKVSSAVKSISLKINQGKTLALVGESGSGKSVTALSILQLLPFKIASHSPKSSIKLNGEELINMKHEKIRSIRGDSIAMIFQEPMTSLNPYQKVGNQIEEILIVHQGLKRKIARERTITLLEKVRIPKPIIKAKAYPHQLSGGQRQRVMIAMALANEPQLLIADEPTTALDVTVEKVLLDLLTDLQHQMGMSILFITHDLYVVKKFADYVCVMKDGEIVESGDVETVFTQPKHEYTKKLLKSLPVPKDKLVKEGKPLLNAKNLEVNYLTNKSFIRRKNKYHKAVKNVSIEVYPGCTTGLVGESGSGKTSLAKALLGIEKSKGQIKFDGKNLSSLDKRNFRSIKKDFQIVFQDPFGSLSPRQIIGEIIGEGLKVHQPSLNKSEKESKILQTLAEVELDASFSNRFPHELSGGERQRVAIARAIILKPKLILLDEPTSALDVSIQMQIINLLVHLQEKYSLSYLFISHDLGVIRSLSDIVYVMKDGVIVEYGMADQVFNKPNNEYTKELINASIA